MIALQAGCVAIGGRAVLIEGAPGVGKSSLALALIDRGAVLVGDDSVVLERTGDAIYASPHANTRGLLEVRNLGLLQFPILGDVPVALAISLDAAAPRYIETPPRRELLGIALPHLLLTPRDPLLALKAELALARYGTLTQPLPSAGD